MFNKKINRRIDYLERHLDRHISHIYALEKKIAMLAQENGLIWREQTTDARFEKIKKIKPLYKHS